jgi:hypothetical protein
MREKYFQKKGQTGKVEEISRSEYIYELKKSGQWLGNIVDVNSFFSNDTSYWTTSS